MQSFKANTNDQNAQVLADYLPDGKMVLAKNIEGTNLRKLLIGLAQTFTTYDNAIEEIVFDYYPNETDILLTEWESALGIPDGCFNATGDLSERRDHVVIKLAKENVQTRDDFIGLAYLLGFVITINSLAPESVFPLPFQAGFSPDADFSRFTMVVTFLDADENFTFPFNGFFPIPFSSGVNNIVQCLFNRLKPANVNIIYRFV